MKSVIPAAALVCFALAACSQPTPPPQETLSGEHSAARDASLQQPALEQESAQHEDTVVTKFAARGNEPFWGVDVDGTTLRYSRMGEGEAITLHAERLAYAKGVEFSGEHEGKAYNLNIRSQACPNTMSDDTHEFTATFDYGDETLHGCADRVE